MISADTPTRTIHFCGRKAELEEMTRCLMPGLHERRAVVLSGLGSFGKTQLARQFQFLHAKHYTSQIWIRSTSFSGLDRNFPVSKIVLNIDEYKQDRGSSRLALMPPSTLPFHHIKARLESGANKDWLLVIDDIQDLQEHYRLSEFLPACEHGTIIYLTSRKNLRLPTSLYAKEIEVGALDLDAAAETFLARFYEEYPSISPSAEGKFEDLVLIKLKLEQCVTWRRP
jgi:hypothetical protein